MHKTNDISKFDELVGKVQHIIDENENYFLSLPKFSQEFIYDKLTEENIDFVYKLLESNNVIEEIKEVLADRYFINKENLIDGYFLQPISKEIYDRKYRLYKKDSASDDLIPVDLTPYHTFTRVALTLAQSVFLSKENLSFSLFSSSFAEFFCVMALNYGFGAGRILANAGAFLYKNATTLINCTVMRQIPDSIQGIMKVAEEAALTLKAGAGVGYDFSSIRPKGSFVHGAGAETSGVVSFAEIFDKTCSVIMAAGGRRGAQMAVIDIQHPESVDFFQAKRKDGTLRYFNISVGLTKNFIDAVRQDVDFEQWFWEPDKSVSVVSKGENEATLDNGAVAKVIRKDFLPYDYPEYNYFVFHEDHNEIIYNKRQNTVFKKRVFKKVNAKKLYDTIMQSTYDYAEPGVLFLDNINKGNPLKKYENIRTTNPCGEQPLPFGGSCNLGSIFLHSFVKEPFNYSLSPEANFDWNLLLKVARIMNKYLDAVNNISNLPLSFLVEEAMYKRRHGLGVSGLADMLVALGLKYSSVEARNFFEKIMRTIAEASLLENILLARLLPPAPVNVTLKDWLDSPHYSFLSNHPLIDKIDPNTLLRYSHATSIAPTGTMSLSWGNNISNGVEPIFSASYVRNIRVPGKKTKVDETVYNFSVIWYKNKMIKENLNVPEDFVKQIIAFETTNDLDVESHLYMQAAAQKYVDSAISKTCNIPTDYDYEKFKEVYLLAFDMGLKGFTTFRFNPKFSVGVLTKKEDLENMKIKFVLEDGSEVVVKGSEKIIYDGEEHLASNLYEALKEGIYGKM